MSKDTSDNEPMLGSWIRAVSLVSAGVLLTACGDLLGPSGPSGPPPDPMSGEIVELRERGIAATGRALDQAARLLGGEVVGRGSHDRCWEGQRNYKVDEGFDYRCSLRSVVVVGFDDDFRSRMRRFDERLFAAGWQCDRHFECESNSRRANEYWDLRRAERIEGQPFPIWKLPTKTDGYERAGVRLYLDYASTVPGSTYGLESATLMSRSGWPLFHQDERPLDIPAVLRAGKQYPYLVVLETETDYFTEE